MYFYVIAGKTGVNWPRVVTEKNTVLIFIDDYKIEHHESIPKNPYSEDLSFCMRQGKFLINTYVCVRGHRETLLRNVFVKNLKTDFDRF